MEERSEKEDRIRSITKLYYSNPKVQDFLLKFSKDREVVPRYFEGFGKRPDTLQYPSDIMGLVNKGATSFHGSEELWHDPLSINSDMSSHQLSAARKSWDLLIDIDSPFLDCSKIAAKLIIAALEQHGIKNYGIKFSGSKGFHLIISGKAFPRVFQERETREMFPEWPRAISQFLMDYIRKDYNKQAGEILTDFAAIERRTNVSKDQLLEIICTKSNKPAQKGYVMNFVCPVCNMKIDRRDAKVTKRRLRCLNASCPGVLELTDTKEYYYDEYEKDPDNEKLPLSSDKYPEYFEAVKGVHAEKVAALDLVLVAPRHLFRTPYSLHEKTALASVVLTKQELENFSPKDANPMQIKIREFVPEQEEGEAKKLLAAALSWKQARTAQDEQYEKKDYTKYTYEKIDLGHIEDDMFPAPIQKLLKGLKDGKKRGLFILITFLRSLNFSPEKIHEKIKAWNMLNEPPLREGYVKNQLDWHFKQKKQILPPNYDNQSFYKDLGLIEKKPEAKNPIVEVLRKARQRH
ncbi:hypothetical protein KW805_03205 [Candidatus Pacearchaeota archaeon]|nr:hypothetical protein [Candidatus Pacearchaeota archaeon]